MLGDIETIAKIMNGTIYGEGVKGEIAVVSTDTRKLPPGALFFALRGEKYDGHDFIEQAWEKDARAVVISDPALVTKHQSAGQLMILVDDTLKALHRLARAYRERFQIPVIGITGSNGKTTTKDMVGAVLAERINLLKTEGNYNNEIGLPLTLLQLEREHQAAVLEMGMRGLGEIAALCAVAKPTAGVITNIGITHYELLGSVENIAKAKGELLEHLPADGFCLLNREDSWSLRLSGLCRGKVVYFGFSPEAHIRGTELKHTARGMSFILEVGSKRAVVHLPVPGEHNVLNALAAAGVGTELGLELEEIAAGLAKVKLSAMRLATLKGLQGSIIINDTYNANPSSTKASLNILLSRKKQRAIAVLGTMRELGEIAEEEHRLVGEYAARLGVDYLLTVGEMASSIAAGALAAGMPPNRVFTFQGNEETKQYLAGLLAPGDVVLVKGSRAVRMEEIVEHISWSGGKCHE